MGTARNHVQAGNHCGFIRWGIDRLASLCRKVSGTVSRRDGCAVEPRPRVERDVAVIIAKRAVRVNNRNAKQAAKYERKHTILATLQGRKC